MLRSSPMLQPIADLPQGVLGFEATGKIHASDFRDVLMPAVRAVWERDEEVRIVLVFERWEGMSSGAAWEDTEGRDEEPHEVGSGLLSSQTSTA